jgi:hypothetical protein
MKLQTTVGLVVVSFTLLRSASGQGFVNLDFEDAIIVPDPSSSYYPYAVYTSDAIPGWTVAGNYLGPNDIIYNDTSLGAPTVALFGLNSIYSSPPLDGAYSIDLYGGLYPFGGGGVSIGQTGLVPGNAASICFVAQGVPQPTGGPLLISLGGQNIPFSAISTGPNYTFYGGNIPSTLVGQVEQLTFSAPTGVNNFWEIDDIQFSSSSVPEPSVFGLLALGGLFYSLRRSK